MSTTPIAAPVAPTPVEPTDREGTHARFRSEIARAYALGPGDAALVLRSDAEPVVVPRAFANAADALTRFRSLDEHAREIAARAGDALGERTARRVLEQLAAHGLLTSEPSLLRPRRHTGVGARITAAAVLAHTGVPLRLEASLRGAIEHARAAGRPCAFMVLDAGRDRTTQRLNRDTVRALRSSSGVPLVYAGFAEKLAYAERLAVESGVDRALVRFALGLDDLAFGPGPGANRNAMLLHHVGEAFISLGDDADPRLARHPATQPVLAFDSGDCEDLFFYPDRSSLLDSLLPAREPLFDVHEALLGHTLHDLAAQVFGRGRVDLDAMTPEMLRGAASSKARVVATMTGTYGDSGLESPAPLATYMHAESRARLLRTELDYLTAMSSPELVRVVKRPTVQPARAFATTSFALDARLLLPPFFPFGRGEGALFGRTMEACFDEHFVGSLPRAVYLARSRGAYPSRLARAPRRLSDLLAACVADASFGSSIGDARSRLTVVGRHLVAIARSPLNAMRGYVHARMLATAQETAERAESLLRAPGAPTFWAAEMRDRLCAESESLRQQWDRPVDDVLPGRGADDAWQIARRQMRAFGELLEAWPAIYDAAQRLRVEGVRVAHALAASE